MQFGLPPCFGKVSICAMIAACVYGARAETWSGTKSFDADVTITDAVTLDGEVTVEVASGKSVVISGVIDGEGGSLVKTGAGTLELSGANAYDGGTTISAGYLRVSNDGALGTGTVEIAGSGTAKCELDVIGRNIGKGKYDPTITIANEIRITGQSAAAYPAMMFFYQNCVMSGRITADHDFYFYDDYQSAATVYSTQYNRYGSLRIVTFANEVSAVGTISYSGWCMARFEKKVTAEAFTIPNTRTLQRSGDTTYGNNSHGSVEFLEPCAFKTVRNFNGYIYCGAADVLEGAFLDWYEPGASSWEGGCGSVNFNVSSTGYDQSVAGLQSPDWATPKAQNFNQSIDVSGSQKTLTITGVAPEEGETTREVITNLRLNKFVALTLDAYDGFTQTFRNRAHSTAQPITVSKGTLKLVGSTLMQSVPTLTIDEGAEVIIDVTSTNVLKGVTALTVNGTLTVAAGTVNAPFYQAGLNLTVGRNGKLAFANGGTLELNTFTYDGKPMAAGEWTSEHLPGVLSEGLTLSVKTTGGVPVPTASATWTDASGEDDLVTTMANWEGEPETLDLTGGTLGVSLAAGTGFTYVPNTRLCTIANDRAAATSPALTIGPSEAGATLTVDGPIRSSGAGQLILQGHIRTPYGHDQGSSTADAYSLYSVAGTYDATAGLPEGCYKGADSSKHSLPLVVNGVTVDKPVRLTSNNTGGCALYAVAGTENVFNGDVTVPSPWSYFDVAEDATVTFNNGWNAEWAMRKAGLGTFTVNGKPMTSTSYFQHEKGTIRLNAENCTFAGSKTGGEGFNITSAATLEFVRSGAFNSDTLTFMTSGSNEQRVEFHCTTQKVGIAAIRNTHKSSTLNGDYPAMLEITGQRRADTGEKFCYALTNIVQVTGGLGFHVCADSADVVFPLSSKAFQSCGDLEVSGGTLELKANASWLNGTNFVARGTGTLKFDGSRQVDKRFAVLTIDGEGKVEIASGETLAVAECRVGGEKVEDGVYSAADLQEGHPLYGHLTGGILRVGKFGILLIVR